VSDLRNGLSRIALLAEDIAVYADGETERRAVEIKDLARSLMPSVNTPRPKPETL